jgi:hypothetical protein
MNSGAGPNAAATAYLMGTLAALSLNATSQQICVAADVYAGG